MKVYEEKNNLAEIYFKVRYMDVSDFYLSTLWIPSNNTKQFCMVGTQHFSPRFKLVLVGTLLIYDLQKR